MKKVLILLLSLGLLFVSKEASAQWSAVGGFTSFQYGGKDVDKNDKVSYPGFFFGVVYDYAFSSIEGLTVEPGLTFSHYGKTITETKLRANYLNIPVNLKYSVALAPDLKIGAFTGPRFNIGLGGNLFKSDFGGNKLFDAQWGLGVALSYLDAVQLRLSYDYGITKAVHLGDKTLNIRRDCLNVGVGFMF